MTESSKMMKNMIIGGVAAFVFVFVFEFLVHGFLMKGMYEATSSLWRPQEESSMGIMILSQFLFTLAIAFFYPIIGNDKNCNKTIPFAFGLGLVMAMPQIASYSYMPIPFTITLCWTVAAFFKAFGSSIIIGKVMNR